MRRISFALTTEQVKNKTKTVTRRNDWAFLKAGQLVQPIEKGMGLKKGEKQKLIGDPIRILSVTEEPLNKITPEDVIREGFPELTPGEFVDMYTKHNKCDRREIVTRIEFEYL